MQKQQLKIRKPRGRKVAFPNGTGLPKSMGGFGRAGRRSGPSGGFGGGGFKRGGSFGGGGFKTGDSF